jgi:hypothetical protein
VRFAAEFLRLAGARKLAVPSRPRGGFIHIHDVARVYLAKPCRPRFPAISCENSNESARIQR